jgi:Cellulase (glycosyl hydrolase family 5)
MGQYQGATTHRSRKLRWGAALIVASSLSACGGGGGGDASATNTPTNGLNPQSLIQSATIDAVSQLSKEAEARVPGHTPPDGTVISDRADASLWRFSSSKVMAYTPGSIGVTESGHVALRFDFGCQVQVISARTSDCRNLVTARRFLKQPLKIGEGDHLSLELRNPDASVNISVLLWDSGGQVLRYPVQLRSIESNDPSVSQRVYIRLDRPSSFWSGANNGKIQTSITAIAVDAHPFINDFATGGVNYPAGVVEIGDIRHHTALSLEYSWTGINPATDHAQRNVFDQFAISSKTLEPAALDRAAAAGFKIIRRDVNWAGAERNGQYSFATFKTGSQELAKRNMKALWVLAYGHPDHGNGPPVSDEDQAAFANYAKAAAAELNTPVTYGFEIWNEPESIYFWPNPDVAAYARLAQKTTAAIKSVAPAIPVITGGITASADSSFFFGLANRASEIGRVDAMAYHTYRRDTISQTGGKRVLSYPEMLAADMPVTRTLANSGGLRKPLLDTEGGYSSWYHLDPTVYGNGHDARARSRQAILVMRRMLTQVALDAPLVTLYNLFDENSNPEDKEANFGLLDNNMNPKASHLALTGLYQLLKGSTYTGYSTDTPAHTHALNWKTAEHRTTVMWIDHPDFQNLVTVPQGTSVKTWAGSDVVLANAPDGKSRQFTLTEAMGPVYLSR